MVSIVLGALAIAGVIVLAARHAREHRALAADVRALQSELQHARGAVGVPVDDPTTGPRPVRTDAGAEVGALSDAGADATRGPRTLH